MQTITVKTSQNIDIDYQVAGIGDRIKARLIDYSLFYILFLVLIVTATQALDMRSKESGETIATIMVSWLIICAFYDVLTEIFLNGQSIGKRVIRIRVMSANGSRATVGQYLLRWIFRIVDISATMGAAAITSIAFTDNKQRIGDLVAGTVIIKTNPIEKLEELTFNDGPSDEPVTFKEVLQLSDEEITLVRDVIRNFQRTGNSLIVYKLAMRIQEHLSITCPPELNDYEFLELVLKDYDKLVI